MTVAYLLPVIAPVLLYDGNCGFCDGAVKFILRRDPGGEVRFATVQGAYGASVVSRHPELAGVDSLIWVEGSGASERVWIRSDGALRSARYLGGIWRALGALGYLVPRPIRDAAYDAFARRRYRWFGTSENCELPKPEELARFI
jgi:predicted DCC family thiol-disulfide oxidoreductase YuxK